MTQPDNTIAPLLYSAEELSSALSVSTSYIHSMNNSERIPAPRKLGARRLWSVVEIEKWIVAGCPPRSEWMGFKDVDS